MRKFWFNLMILASVGIAVYLSIRNSSLHQNEGFSTNDVAFFMDAEGVMALIGVAQSLEQIHNGQIEEAKKTLESLICVIGFSMKHRIGRSDEDLRNELNSLLANEENMIQPGLEMSYRLLDFNTESQASEVLKDLLKAF